MPYINIHEDKEGLSMLQTVKNSQVDDGHQPQVAVTRHNPHSGKSTCPLTTSDLLYVSSLVVLVAITIQNYQLRSFPLPREEISTLPPSSYRITWILVHLVESMVLVLNIYLFAKQRNHYVLIPDLWPGRRTIITEIQLSLSCHSHKIPLYWHKLLSRQPTSGRL